MSHHLNTVRGSGTGQTVVFQHGLCGNAAQTQEAFPNDPRFRLLTVECRGHGASDIGPYTDISIKTFAEDVASQVSSPSIIGGISMGAAISLHLAVHRPDLVKALVLARPAWVIEKAPANNQPNIEIGQLLSQFSPDVAKEKFLASELAKHLSRVAPDNLASLSTFFSREPIANTAALLRGIATDGPGVTEAELRAIKIPTLIIATEQDYVHPMAHAEMLQTMIPNAKLKRITPKGVDKQRYITEFQSTLLKFFEENA
jgi:pimeloyl-ACP methyl ester carboxylesterase